jgi:DNA-binding NarL/FixJ family response regulator
MRTLLVLGEILNTENAGFIFQQILSLANNQPGHVSVARDSQTGLNLSGLAHVDNRHFDLVVWDLTTPDNERFKGARILTLVLDSNPKCTLVAITRPEDKEGRKIAIENGASLAVDRIPTQPELEKIVNRNLS